MFELIFKDLKTGEIKSYIDKNKDWEGEDGLEFWWTEGNGSCDCNRGLMVFDLDDPKCGEERFALLEVRHNGKVEILEDGE